jgi:AraC family ethanolamine operon transcriptional activator
MRNLSGTLGLPGLGLHRPFQDIDVLGSAFLVQGLEVAQLTSGLFEGSLTTVYVNGIQLVRLVTNSQIYALGSKSSDEVIFCVSLAVPSHPLVSHKRALTNRTLFGFDSTGEVDLIIPRALQIATVTIPLATLQQYLHDVERDDLNAKFFRRNAIQVADRQLNDLRTYLDQIFYLAETNPGFLERSPALIAGDLLPLLVNCFSDDVCPDARARPFRRADIVREAEDFMLAHLDRPLTLEAICIAVKTSKSALSYGFHDIFGLSPMVYLKTVRLNGARRALKIADPTTTTVLGVANRYGFWHMGHFSRDYRQMFGESPSNTLRGIR